MANELGGHGDHHSPQSKGQWRKNLYSNVGYEDNYTDVSFLAQLRTNIHKRHVSFGEAFFGAAKVTEQLCILCMFNVFYLYLIDSVLQPEVVFVITSVVTCTCYIIYFKCVPLKRHTPMGTLSVHGKTVAIFLILGQILSPVLKTLTDTISTDTINATAIFMMLVHLIFFDYKVPVSVVSSALSMNAAIFGSLCLASRLPSSYHAFVLLTVSVECFVLYPPFAYSVRKKLSLLYLSILLVITCCLLQTVGLTMLKLFILVVLFINVLCPALFVRWEKHKNNIYGPWDEAVISCKPYENKIS